MRFEGVAGGHPGVCTMRPSGNNLGGRNIIDALRMAESIATRASEIG
jgi:hypothetical protein